MVMDDIVRSPGSSLPAAFLACSTPSWDATLLCRRTGVMWPCGSVSIPNRTGANNRGAERRHRATFIVAVP